MVGVGVEVALSFPRFNPLAFYLWGFLKNRVCKNNSQILSVLKTNLRKEMRTITPDILENCNVEIRWHTKTCTGQKRGSYRT